MVEVLILKKRKDFLRAAKGFKVIMPSFILQAARSLSESSHSSCHTGECALGYTATKKLGKAHIRNRTKRRLRAAAREIFPQNARELTDYVLIGRYNTATIDFSVLCKDMEKALNKINLLFDGNKSKEISHEKSVDSTH